mmetsp:Transcript_2906/g.9140  ORF Transcript_2906/g.9140 Transcript_2906/m.9140 type:complete len:191 (+) Transcript_2906:126-698(+)
MHPAPVGSLADGACGNDGDEPRAAGAAGRAPPVLSRWQDDAGSAVDVLLHWHPSLPGMLPQGAEEALCVVRLCAAAPPLECLEARLQRHHLQRPLDRWSPDQLRRLMAVMSRPGAPGARDEVSLRRPAAGRAVVDVLFGGGAAPPSPPPPPRPHFTRDPTSRTMQRLYAGDPRPQCTTARNQALHRPFCQ